MVDIYVTMTTQFSCKLISSQVMNRASSQEGIKNPFWCHCGEGEGGVAGEGRRGGEGSFIPGVSGCAMIL